MSGLEKLQQALPNWVRLERRSGDPEVSHKTVEGVEVTEVNLFPETPSNAVRADVYFVMVAPTEGFPERDELIATVTAAFGDGEYATITADDLASGPSYITLGGWLGSQDLALMLIGAVELAGIAKAITPAVLGMEGEMADRMAGNGFVMIGPSSCWKTTVEA